MSLVEKNRVLLIIRILHEVIVVRHVEFGVWLWRLWMSCDILETIKELEGCVEPAVDAQKDVADVCCVLVKSKVL